ncbi:hypothetical protein AB0I77_05415 [Streptomyces sp. NPDC050619]|uniref:hypothetical protein n=1 Tax=Streptomyces sp. NPDC050619 TaxID=3157214 RepID=UPI00341942B4
MTGVEMFPGEREDVEPLFEDEPGQERDGTEPRVVTRQERDTAARTWLLLSADSIETTRAHWDKVGISLLKCGALFGAVRMESALVHMAAGSDDLDKVRDFLTAALFGGPVFIDHNSARYYALVPASTADRLEWQDRLHTPKAEMLGRDSYLGVPRPGLDEPDGEHFSYWCVPMYGPGDLCDPEAVSQLVTHGRHLLAMAGEIDAQK